MLKEGMISVTNSEYSSHKLYIYQSRNIIYKYDFFVTPIYIVHRIWCILNPMAYMTDLNLVNLDYMYCDINHPHDCTHTCGSHIYSTQDDLYRSFSAKEPYNEWLFCDINHSHDCKPLTKWRCTLNDMQ